MSETRIATDIGVAWALAAAALVTLDGRGGGERGGCSPRPLSPSGCRPRVGGLACVVDTRTGRRALWIAVLAVLLLALPEGRRSSPVTRWAIAGAFAVTLAGQVAGALVEPDARDLLSVAPHAGAAHAVDRAQEFAGVAVALVV